jgi:hypothetical protein
MVSQKKLTWVVVGLIILLGMFLRLYRLQETVMFQGDQGRDAILVKNLIINGNIPLLGPVTSVGNMYLGPFYYYFMAPWLRLTYPNPIGPAYGVALVSILTLPLVYIFGKKMMGVKASIAALLLFSLTDPLILYSRFSWNPNLAPTVSLVIIWCLYKMLHDHKPVYLIYTSIAFSLLTQLHYLALTMGLVIALLTAYGFMVFRNERRAIIKYALLGLFIYLISWTPLIVFDWSHQGLIHKGFVNFFNSNEQHIQPAIKILTTIKEVEGRALMLMSQMFGSQIYWLDRVMVYGSLLLVIYWWKIKLWSMQRDTGFLIVFVGLLVTVTSVAFYRGTIFDHYLLFALPMAIYYWGFILGKIWEVNRIAKLAVMGVLGLFCGYNLSHATTFTPAAPSINNFKMISDTIYPQLKNMPYNLTLLSESNDYKGMNYRYFLNTTSHPPLSPDDYTTLKQLVVIDEIHTNNPLAVNIFEIKAPGLTKLKNYYSVPNGPDIYIYE